MDILCHPSRIGLYIKDKIYVVVLMFISFALLFMGVLALKVYPQNYYSLESAENISFAISKSNIVPTIKYENKKIVGDKSYMVVMDDYSACFLPENYSTNNEITKKKGNGGKIFLIVFLAIIFSGINFGFFGLKYGKKFISLEKLRLMNLMIIMIIPNIIQEMILIMKKNMDYFLMKAIKIKLLTK